MTSPDSTDPFSRFLSVYDEARPKRRDGKRFSSGEHLWLGGHGAKRALERFNTDFNKSLDPELFNSIPRKNTRDVLRYGELVALSGDFYESPESLFEEKPSPLPWLWEGNDLGDLRELFGEELRWIEDRNSRQGSAYPENNLRLAWNAKSYVELALRNTDHFGWHNLLAYRKHHAEALRLAASARGRDDETFRRARYTNAFADHFLTDGFAAGHVRVPRAEIRAWADERGFNEKVAGALSKVLHDQDGHIDAGSLHGVHDENRRGDDDGLPVQNSLGANWFTRCDGQLFLEAGSETSPAVEQAVAAVSASVTELLVAWQEGTLPRGTYEATKHVPFPRPGSATLAEKFPASLAPERLEALWQSVGWYAKIPWISGMERRHIEALFEALPAIMERFRANVAADVARDPELTSRLAAPYIAAYRSVA